jgi:hypothetical protein
MIEMPIISTQLHTFKCSVPDCKNERTLAGKLDIQRKSLEKEGWCFDDLQIGGNDYDLCPNHNQLIREFFGFDNYPIGTYPNEHGDVKVEA